jgi:hypothetical protein
MASLGPTYCVVFVLHIGGSKESEIELVLVREPRLEETCRVDGHRAVERQPCSSAVTR